MFPVSKRAIGKAMMLYGLVMFFYEGIAVLRFPNMRYAAVSSVFPISATVLMFFSIGTSIIGFLIWQSERELSRKGAAMMALLFAGLLAACGFITLFRSGRAQRELVGLVFIAGALAIAAFSTKDCLGLGKRTIVGTRTKIGMAMPRKRRR